MAENHTYRIDLDLRQSAQSKAALKTLNDSFQQNDKQINELNADFQRLQQNGIDASNEYRKILHKEIEDYDKKIAKLEEERVKLIANKNLTKEQLQQGLKDIDAKQKRMRAYQKELQVRVKIQKLTGKTVDGESKLLKIGSKMIKMQEKMNKLLGKEGKLRQGIIKAVSGAARATGVAFGGLMALGGAAVASSGSVYDREMALKSLKSPATAADVQDVFINSGGRADFKTIVESINKLSAKFSGEELRGHALLDIENPGWAETVLRSNDVNATAEESRRLLDQIRKNTGSTDLASAFTQASKAWTVTGAKVSQLDFIQAYSALQGLGFDEDRIREIVNHVAAQQGDFIENFNKTDFSKWASGQQKTLVKGSGVGIQRLDRGLDIESPEMIAARETQKKLAEFQLKKDEIVADVLLAIHKSGILDKLADMVRTLFTPTNMDNFVNLISKGLDLVNKLLDELNHPDKLLEDTADVIKKIPGLHDIAVASEAIGGLLADGDIMNALSKAKNLGPLAYAKQFFANGGLATQPSICGEAGPELVLPLTRPQRCEQLMNQYLTTNNFNINGNPNALGLSQQINNHKFIRNASMW